MSCGNGCSSPICPGPGKCQCRGCKNTATKGLDLSSASNAAVSVDAPTATASRSGRASGNEVYNNLNHINVELPKVDISDRQVKPVILPHLTNTPVYPGAFLKYGVVIDKVEYLLKTSGTHIDMAEGELVSNRLATLFGLNVPSFRKCVSKGSVFFGSVDFTKNNNEHVRLHHFSELMPEYPQDWDCLHIIEKIREVSSSPDEDVASFVRMIVFDSVVGNNDRHSKNIGFLSTSAGLRLSPFYDNCSYVALMNKIDTKLNVVIRGVVGAGSESEPTLKDYVECLECLGFGGLLAEISSGVDLSGALAVIKAGKMRGWRKEWFSQHVDKQLKLLRSLCKK